MKGGTAPHDTTALVCVESPLAILVRAQAASNCSDGLQSKEKFKIIKKSEKNIK